MVNIVNLRNVTRVTVLNQIPPYGISAESYASFPEGEHPVLSVWDLGNPNAEEESIDRLWLVVRSLKNPEGKFDYKIKKFDAIKLGRVRFRVKDFRCEQMNLTERELYNQEIKEA